MVPTDLLVELEPVAATLVDRHLGTSREWFPHELIPYERGRAGSGRAWSPVDADLAGATPDPTVRTALYVNLLTEDNLPYYFRDVERMFGADGVWGTWVRRWTAEEGRHSMAIYGYLMVTRAVDPVALERGRMCQVSTGEAPAPATAREGFVYLALQELATRISHRNTGRMIGDPVGYELMARVAADENLHYLFYRDMASAAFALDPSGMVIATEHEVRTFAMPGTGIPDFDRHAAAMARAGVYDLAIHHAQILVPVVLNHWRVAELTGLTPEADSARERLVAHIDRVGRVAARLTERRLENAAVR
ncbi:MAG TPA: acyl-ACP desaturase [Acidimicrobiales bacterium]|nr:acyl-ACP desaturase [Acidimicrobiales bacterium]